MKNKRWLAAVLIIGLLAVAFFWGGNHQGSATRIDERSSKTQAINDNTASSQIIETQQKEEYNKQAGVKTGKGDENISGLSTKDKTSALPTKSAGAEKSAAETDKKPEKAAEKAKQEKTAQKVQADASVKPADNTGNKKDKYLTDPIPEGKPKPVEWQAATINKKKDLTCTLSVTCKTILDNMDNFNKDKLEVLPKDGIIYKTRKVTFYEGESVFDVLLRELKNNKIHMEFEMTPIYNSNYIEGIHNLYEFDCGELSGWMYKVNSWFPNYGCSRYALKDGDVVEWIYTCDLGRDIGGGMAVGGKGQ